MTKWIDDRSSEVAVGAPVSCLHAHVVNRQTIGVVGVVHRERQFARGDILAPHGLRNSLCTVNTWHFYVEDRWCSLPQPIKGNDTSSDRHQRRFDCSRLRYRCKDSLCKRHLISRKSNRAAVMSFSTLIVRIGDHDDEIVSSFSECDLYKAQCTE